MVRIIIIDCLIFVGFSCLSLVCLFLYVLFFLESQNSNHIIIVGSNSIKSCKYISR